MKKETEKTLKVLVADDAAMIRRRIIEMLDELEVVELAGEAQETQEALSLLKQEKPDVLILDIRMPGGGGGVVLQAAKAQPEPPVVIVFTSFAYPQYRKRFLAEGADYFIDKGTDLERLREIIFTLRDTT